MVEKSGRPAYLQLADQIRSKILSGGLPDGSVLPSTSKLATEHDVSTSVVKAAVSVLRTEGFVVGQQGKGVFVRTAGATLSSPVHPTAEDGADERLTEILTTLRDLSKRMSRLEAEVFPTQPRTPSAES